MYDTEWGRDGVLTQFFEHMAGPNKGNVQTQTADQLETLEQRIFQSGKGAKVPA